LWGHPLHFDDDLLYDDNLFPVHVAAKYGSWQLIDRFLRKTRQYKFDNRDELYIAIESGNSDVVCHLIEIGKSVDYDPNRKWALEALCKYSDPKKAMMDKLLPKFKDIKVDNIKEELHVMVKL
jgi:hypothetical protein